MTTISPDKIGNIPYFVAKLEKALDETVVVPALTSGGTSINGGTLTEALTQILALIDAIEPA